jgi:hypothetical protein
MRRLFPLLVGSGLALMLSSGCAYRLAEGDAPRVPIAVETLTNDTLEPGVELTVAAALRREFGRAGRLRLVEQPVASGYAIQGRIAAVDTVGRTFTPGVRALEYTVSMRLDLIVSGPGGRPVAIDPFATTASEIYLASTDVEISRKNRAEALRRLSALLAARIRGELLRNLASQAGSDGTRRDDVRFVRVDARPRSSC